MVEFDFVTEKEMEENRRFRLIQLRNEEVTEFRNYKMIPALEREVPKDTFAVSRILAIMMMVNMKVNFCGVDTFTRKCNY